MPDETLRLKLFGSAKVEQSGEMGIFVSVKLPTRHALLLLAILHVRQGEPIARRALVELLWPNATQQVQLARFRTCLASVKKILPPGSLTVRDAEIQLVPGTVTSDWEEYNFSPGSDSEYPGDFLAGFNEEWAIDQRLEFREQFCDQMVNLAAQYESSGKRSEAHALLRRALRVDSTHAGARTHSEQWGSEHSIYVRDVAPQASLDRADALTKPVPPNEHPLISTTNWLLEANPREALSLINSTFSTWANLSLEISLPVFERALEVNPQRSEARDRAEAHWIQLLSHAGQLSAKLPQAVRALDSAIAIGDFRCAANIAYGLSYSHLSQADFRTARQYAVKAIMLLRRSSDGTLEYQELKTEFELMQSIIFHHCGDESVAFHLQLGLKERIESLSNPLMRAGHLLVLVEPLCVKNRFDEAHAIIENANQVQKQNRAERLRIWTSACLGTLATHEGETSKATALLEQSLMQGAGVAGRASIPHSQERLAALQCKASNYEAAIETLASSAAFRVQNQMNKSIPEAQLRRKCFDYIKSKVGDEDTVERFKSARNKFLQSATAG